MSTEMIKPVALRLILAILFMITLPWPASAEHPSLSENQKQEIEIFKRIVAGDYNPLQGVVIAVAIQAPLEIL